MNPREIVKFDQLTKHYGQHKGIENLSFTIYEKEIFGFLGPNGAGKTTSIRLMLDLLKPSGGKVEIFGKDVRTNSHEIRGRIGYLPGDFYPYDKMTGKEFLKFSLQLRQSVEKIPQHLFDRLELNERDLNKKIRQYSQGMKQKLGIIHAVAHNPELIILDEPSTGLDPIMQDNLYDLLTELNQKGCTIFFSSHNLPEVEKICERVAIVKEGLLVGFESLESLRKRITKKLKISLESQLSDHPEFQNAAFNGRKSDYFEYNITGSMKSLLKELEGLPVKDIVIPEANLEDIFLSYYEKNKTS